MKFAKLLVALALAGNVTAAFAVTPGYLGNLSGQTVSIGQSFSAGATINDIYTFDIAPESVAVGTTVTINLDIPMFPGAEFELANLMIKFLDTDGFTVLASDSTLDASNALQIMKTLDADTGYSFVLSGNAVGTLGGSYGGVLQAVPVPEADTYALILAGLGLVGFMARRRTV